MSSSEEVLHALERLREGQREHALLAREAIDFARSAEESRRLDLQQFREESRELNRQAMLRGRRAVRVYAVMMLLLGALLATLWINAFSH